VSATVTDASIDESSKSTAERFDTAINGDDFSGSNAELG
jgi:hypothetical protein